MSKVLIIQGKKDSRRRMVRNLEDIMKKVDRYGEIDELRYQMPFLGEMVYVALRCSQTGDGFGGMALRRADFDDLRKNIGHKIAFINVMKQ